MKNSTIQSTVAIQTYANEMIRKLRNLGTASYVAESDKGGEWRVNAVYSNSATESGCREVYL